MIQALNYLFFRLNWRNFTGIMQQAYINDFKVCILTIQITSIKWIRYSSVTNKPADSNKHKGWTSWEKLYFRAVQNKRACRNFAQKTMKKVKVKTCDFIYNKRDFKCVKSSTSFLNFVCCRYFNGQINLIHIKFGLNI